VAVIKRVAVVKCDHCGRTVDLDLSLEYTGGYPFNKALSEAGWGEPYTIDGYKHLCPTCLTSYRKGRTKGI
jgi:hypothetical protein